MPLTIPDGAPPIPEGVLGPAVPEEVLYEAEEPVIYTLRTSLGQRVLAYLADSSSSNRSLLLTPFGDAQLRDLREGRLAVRDALSQSWLWLATLDNQNSWTGGWAVQLSQLPDDHLPRPGVRLLPEHEPAISTCASGPSIARSMTPASVVAYVADRTRRALKALLEFEMDLTAQGRPSDELRALYDLPVQAMSYSSFEIAFSAPRQLFGDPALDKSITRLRRGLRWAASSSSEPLAAETDEERAVVLRALKLLTPPLTGVIQKIDIGGTWMKRTPVALGRDSRRKVHRELKSLRTERVAHVEGRVRVFDLDKLTFTLRETTSGAEVHGVVDEDLYDEVYEYFDTEDRVSIVGIMRGSKLYVAAASLAGDVTNSAN